MTRDTITYAGKEYPVREIKGYLFATTELAGALLGDHDEPVNLEAYNVDELIAYFMTPEDFEVLTDREAWIQCYDEDEVDNTPPESAPQGHVDGYSAFLMVELGRLIGVIDKELEYDLMYAEGLKLYEEFMESGFDDERYSEYDAIINFLKHKNETED